MESSNFNADSLSHPAPPRKRGSSCHRASVSILAKPHTPSRIAANPRAIQPMAPNQGPQINGQPFSHNTEHRCAICSTSRVSHDTATPAREPHNMVRCRRKSRPLPRQQKPVNRHPSTSNTRQQRRRNMQSHCSPLLEVCRFLPCKGGAHAVALLPYQMPSHQPDHMHNVHSSLTTKCPQSSLPQHLKRGITVWENKSSMHNLGVSRHS